MRPWLVLLLAGCASAPPSGWQRGGRPLALPVARWVVGERVVEIAPGGQVTIDGEHELTVDAAGRVFDDRNHPLALLRPDGFLFGPGDEPLGWIGPRQALDEDHRPWLELYPSGELVRLEGDARRPFGVWLGCDAVPAGVQTCLVVSQMIALKLRERENTGMGVGIGVGVGVGVVH